VFLTVGNTAYSAWQLFIKRWLQLRFDFDSTAIRLRRYCRTTANSIRVEWKSNDRRCNA